MRKPACLLVLLGTIALLACTVSARSLENAQTRTPNPSALSPFYCNVEHNVGNMSLVVGNTGVLGVGLSVSGNPYDCFTGELIFDCEFPIGSDTRYLYGGALWIGAVVDGDTLVSTGSDGWSVPAFEFHPDEYPAGDIIYRSTLDPSQPFYEDAVSHQDYIATYADTCRDCPGRGADEISGWNHSPLQIEVTQSSYAWNFPHAEDLVLINYSIRNIGPQVLNEVYVGQLIDADIHDVTIQDGSGAGDDISGFRRSQPATYLNPSCPPDSDIVNLAWSVDNDAEFGQIWNNFTPHITGIRVLRTPSNDPTVSFNWWVSNQDASLDWGPTMRGNLRDFTHGGMGTPSGDRNKYFVMRNGEVDFDQVRTATIGDADSVWLPPPPDRSARWTTGMDTRYLLSDGPFHIDPGETVRFTLAYVAGENFHTDEANFANLPLNPDAWYEGVDFSDLDNNSLWAGWIYDNPGVDSDSDGYRGEFTVCDMGDWADTIWRTGDGVPDYCAASPPPPPTFWLEPGDQSIHVRFNGLNAENSRDVFSRQVDFEGYHAYLSTSGSGGTFSQIASYDIEDYYKYHWDFDQTGWVASDQYPFTLEALRCLYASSCDDAGWHPMDYSRQSPYVMPAFPDTLLYFVPVMANASAFGLETPFVKRFPEAPVPPVLDADSIRALFPGGGDTLYLTPDDYFKYYEYEFTIEDLLPGRTYWVSMTSFDYGTLAHSTASLESFVERRAQSAATLGTCCSGRVGDANGLGGDEPTIGDVALIIDAKFISGTCEGLIYCLSEADVNQSGGTSPTCDDVTIGDVSIVIDYLFITQNPNLLIDCL